MKLILWLLRVLKLDPREIALNTAVEQFMDVAALHHCDMKPETMRNILLQVLRNADEVSVNPQQPYGFLAYINLSTRQGFDWDALKVIRQLVKTTHPDVIFVPYLNRNTPHNRECPPGTLYMSVKFQRFKSTVHPTIIEHGVM